MADALTTSADLCCIEIIPLTAEETEYYDVYESARAHARVFAPVNIYRTSEIDYTVAYPTEDDFVDAYADLFADEYAKRYVHLAPSTPLEAANAARTILNPVEFWARYVTEIIARAKHVIVDASAVRAIGEAEQVTSDHETTYLGW